MIEPANEHYAAPATTASPFHQLQRGSFAGVPCAQIWADFMLWEALLNEYPETKAVIELGTWMGGFSLYLHAQAQARGMGFRTYDSIDHTSGKIPGFERLDVFAKADEVGCVIAAHEPVLLLCDNGNKPREVRTFAPYLADPRSRIVVHDWMTEFFPGDIPDGLELAHAEFCEEIGSMSRVLRVRR